MYKRILSTLLVLCLVVGLLPTTAWAGELEEAEFDVLAENPESVGQATSPTSGICGENLTWTLDDAGTLTISGIGAMYNYSEYSNHAPWFERQAEIKRVVMQRGVNFIGNYAFYYCKGLTSVSIPDSVTSIGEGAFRGCSSLTSVTIPNSVTSIKYGAFAGCSSLTSVTIPNSVTSIGNYVFASCSNLKSVTIPNSVTSIGSLAFQYCSSLTSVTIPNSVTSIGREAFRYCSSLTSVTIPNSVTSIGRDAFQYCSSLTSVTIPNSVTSIQYGTFQACSNLTNVTIPNSVTSIGRDAFKDCSSLTSVAIPNSVTSIGRDAFSGCSSLTDIYYGGLQENWEKLVAENQTGIPDNTVIHYNTYPGPNAPISPENKTTMSLQSTQLDIYAGSTNVMVLTFAVECTDKDASGAVSWTSNTPEVFDVTGAHISRPYSGTKTLFDVYGNALSEGTATITAFTSEGVSESFAVTVKAKLEGLQIELFEAQPEIYVGQENCTALSLVAKSEDENVSGTLTWTSSNPEVFQLTGSTSQNYAGKSTRFSVNGNALSEGETTITISANDGTKKSFTVDVKAKSYKPYNITLNAVGGSISANKLTTDQSGKLSSLPIPTKKGYIFAGWFTERTDGEWVTLDTVFQKDTTIYAHWLLDFNPVIYHASWLLRDDLPSVELIYKDLDTQTTPSAIMVAELKPVMGPASFLWETMNATFKGLSDFSEFKNYSSEVKDLYSALILSTLEASASYTIPEIDGKRQILLHKKASYQFFLAAG